MGIRQLHLLICLLFGCYQPCLAQELRIDWGSSAIVDKIVTSDGSAITLAEFSVELGGFTDGFVPTSENVSEWTLNWRIFDAITLLDTDGNGPGGSTADGYISGGGTNALFAGSARLQPDQSSASEDSNGLDTFGPGQQAYVFIRNGDYPSTLDNGVEWLLYTKAGADGWVFPAVSDSQPSFPEQWSAADADSAVWGAVNGATVGAGEHTDNSSDFLLRTHTFVPEPSVFMLFVIALGALLRRTR